MTTVTAQPTRGQPPGLVVGGVVTAQAIPGASGGLEVLNLLTGGPGFERVLTTSDLTANAPGGPINAVQFNNPLGAFDGDADFTYDGTTLDVTHAVAATPVVKLQMNSTGEKIGIELDGAGIIPPNNEYTALRMLGSAFGSQRMDLKYQYVDDSVRLEIETGAIIAQFGRDTIALGGSYNDPNNAPFTVGLTGYGQPGIGDTVIKATLFIEGQPFLLGTTPATAGRFWVRSDTPPVPMFTTNAGGDNVLAYVDDVVPQTRLLTAGAGMIGGGDLTADRTFDVVANADGSIVVNADDVQVGVLATDAQHGTRGGGTLHAAFDNTQAGFAPQSPGGTNTFLRADGTWAAPPEFGEYSGEFDASAGTFPGGAATNQGDWYNTTVAGTVDGEAFSVGDLLIALIDNPSTTTFAGNWSRIPNISAADVTGPASSIDNRLATFDGVTGKVIQDNTTLTAIADTIESSGNVQLVAQGGLTQISDSAFKRFEVFSEGIRVLGNGVNNPIGGGLSQFTELEFFNRLQQSVGYIGWDSSSTMLIHNRQNQGELRLALTTSGVGARYVFIARPAGTTEISATTEVEIRRGNGPPPGEIVADTITSATGGFRVNNLLTGTGLERVLTTSDLGGLGDVVGPAGATDNAIARYDTATGKLIQDSLVTIDDSGNVAGISTLGIGGGPAASAILELQSTTQGFLPPRMTTVERDAIAAPATGLMIYNTDLQVLEHYNGTVWVDEVPSTRILTAGAGMTGGGNLSADRTFNVVANADGSIVVNADDVQVGVLATDAQHGTRGGGTLHAEATTSVAGFLSAADKTKLDNLNGSFGAEFESDFEALEQSTTSPTYVTPYSYTTASLPAGDYKFEWFYDSGATQDKQVSHRVLIDGVEVSNSEWQIKRGVETDNVTWITNSGHRILTLTAGTHTIAFQYRAANTAYVRNKQVSIFRVA